ncbi:MAG: response regulator [Betaproteobacteria bacterium]|nr:response regulator [Betaproteobacteria bacterium]
MSTLRPVLLVDDNAMDVDLTLQALKRGKLVNPVEVARDGAEVLARVPLWETGERTPVVILLDINMPKVNGLEVVRHLKSREVLRVIPVVMLTTSSLGSDMHAAYRHGANSYVVKPMNFESFTQIIAQLGVYWTSLNRLPE